LDFDKVVAMYSHDRRPQRWILAHPIGTGRSSPLFFLFFYRETTKKYFHNLKWGSTPKHPSHNATKAVMC
jgi:hypothetical protein